MGTRPSALEGLTRAGAALAALLLLGAGAPPPAQPPADLILYDARVWTGEDAQPWAEGVAVRGDRIIAVGSSSAVLALRGPATKVVRIAGRMVTPGFIDAHTHFETATEWFYQIRLFDVDNAATIATRLKPALARIPADAWVTAVAWGEGTARRRWTQGDRAYVPPAPRLAEIDALTGDRPVMFRRVDGAVFTNSEGLRRLRVVQTKPDPAGGSYGRDAAGKLDGMLYGVAAAQAWAALPPRTQRATQVAAQALEHELNGYGITGIHDIARIDALSQRATFRTAVERGHSNMQIFYDLRAAGALTLRVYPLLTLRDFDGLKSVGITPGSGDDMIRYGALKAFIDGALTDEPWQSDPSYSGDFTFRVVDEATMQRDVIAADKAGFDIGMHVLGDKAQRLLLNWYDAAIAANPPRDRRFRLIHAWYPRLGEIARAGRIHAVADVTPRQMLESTHQVESILPPAVQKTAFAWKTMIRNGVRIDLVSDWPGSYDWSSLAPIAPLQNMYMAMVRHPIGAPASAAWHPEEALTIDEVLRAYTVNPAWAAHEDTIKGSIAPGKLADLVVLSRDITQGPPETLLQTQVLWTLLGGKTVAGGVPVVAGSP